MRILQFLRLQVMIVVIVNKIGIVVSAVEETTTVQYMRYQKNFFKYFRSSIVFFYITIRFFQIITGLCKQLRILYFFFYNIFLILFTLQLELNNINHKEHNRQIT